MTSDTVERLRETIEAGVAAAEQLQRMLAEDRRQARPKLRLIQGGVS